MMHCEENNIRCKNSLSKDIHAQLIYPLLERKLHHNSSTITRFTIQQRALPDETSRISLCYILLYEKNFKRYNLHYDLPHIRLCQPLENHVCHQLGQAPVFIQWSELPISYDGKNQT